MHKHSRSRYSPKAKTPSSGGNLSFKDRREQTITQLKLEEKALNSVRQQGMMQLQAKADNFSALFQTPVQAKANHTGLPDKLKSGIENLSGYSMDDVKVHYNSPEPAQLQAHAFAQGNQIHVASGQEKHLPHEAWHVVQQKQGRVKPTRQLKEAVAINDDEGLEKEADVMGARALQLKPDKTNVYAVSSKNDENIQARFKTPVEAQGVVQREILLHNTQNSNVMKQAVKLFVKHVKAQNGDLVKLATNSDMNVNLIFTSISGKYVGEGDTTVRTGGEHGDESNLVDVGVTTTNKAGKIAVNINIVTSGYPLIGGSESVERLVTTMAHEYGLHAERQAQVIIEMRSKKSNQSTLEAIQALQDEHGGFMNEQAQHKELIDESGSGYDVYMDLIARLKTDLTKTQGLSIDKMIKEDQRDQIMNSDMELSAKMSLLKEKGLLWI